MKALKEKRISLRSLWRRGLVILSLFALILAVGCSDSDESGTDGGGGGGTVTNSGKTIVGYTIIDRPACENETQYEGWPIKLDGIKVKVLYDDRTWEDITDTSRLYVSPPRYRNKEWPGNYTVRLTNNAAVNQIDTYAWLNFPLGIKNAIEFHWTGSIPKDTYFSDDIPTFSGLSLEIKYEGADHGDLYHQKLDLPKDWQYWEFSQPTDRDRDFIRVYFPRSAALLAPPPPVSPEVKIPMKKIYYVQKVEFDPAPAFADPIFVFADYVFGTGGTNTTNALVTDDLENAWIKRIWDATIKVSYSDTEEVHTFSVPQVDTMRDFTWSEKLEMYESNPRLKLWEVPAEPLKNPVYKNAVDNKKGTFIRFAYRGIPMERLQVPIYGQFINIQAVAKDGVDVEYDLTGTGEWPDALYMDSIVTLASKIKVTANYALYTDKSVTAPFDLTFDGGELNSAGTNWTRKPGTGVQDKSYGINLAGAIGSSATSDIGIPVLTTLGSGKEVWLPDNTTDLTLKKDATKKVQITYTFDNVNLITGNPKATTIPVSFIKVKGN